MNVPLDGPHLDTKYYAGQCYLIRLYWRIEATRKCIHINFSYPSKKLTDEFDVHSMSIILVSNKAGLFNLKPRPREDINVSSPGPKGASVNANDCDLTSLLSNVLELPLEISEFHLLIWSELKN